MAFGRVAEAYLIELVGWMNEYGSEIQDIESVFHISESCAPSSCFCNEQKDAQSFCKGAIFCSSYCKAESKPIFVIVPHFPEAAIPT